MLKGRWRGAILVVGCLTFLAAGAECASYLANYRAAVRAEKLLRDVRSMEPGQTTGEEVQHIVQQYGGDIGQRFWLLKCESVNPHWKSYAVHVQSSVLNRIGEYDLLHGTGFRQFGTTQWAVYASFGIDDSGRLSCVNFHLSSTPVHRDAVEVNASYSLPYSLSDALTYEAGYEGVHHVQSLGASATTNATRAQVRHLFNFQLECLTNIGGCSNACEVMPSVWLDYQREARVANRPLPREQLDDARCEKLSTR